jgi:hypothetical protein
MLGDRFEVHGIESLATEAVLAGEMAAVLAQWLRQEPGKRSAADAFAACASALRSAQWLWLEDDDRGMGCLRCVIEQVARARTWRVKPDRAAKVEASSKSTPPRLDRGRWLEAPEPVEPGPRRISRTGRQGRIERRP